LSVSKEVLSMKNGKEERGEKKKKTFKGKTGEFVE
jgi:hypothetical protein